MASLLLLASVAPMLWNMGSGAPAATEQMVQDARNGEFLWKYYPQGALKRGEEGRVAFKLTVEPTGTISSCDVTESSGHSALDRETCEIMSLYAQLKPARNEEGRAIRAEQTGFIVWKLPPGAARLASASTTKTMPKPDQIICRKEAATGSLIATTKQCMTRAQWARQERQVKDEIDQLQGKGFLDPHDLDGPPVGPPPNFGGN